MRRLSTTLISGNTRAPSGTTAMPRRTIASGGSPSMRSPLKRMAPPLRARSGMRPRMARMTVVLPAPFGPMRLTISPRATLRLTPRSTCSGPYPASTSSSSSIGSAMRVSEIGLHHRGIPHDVGRPPLGDLLTVVQDHHAVGQAEDREHDVLGHHQRAPALTDLAQER